jgi:hypothetical protein
MPATVTAKEAADAIKAEQRERNSKKIESLPPQLQAIMNTHELKPVRIFNVGHHRWTDRPGGDRYYVINACPSGERYSAPTLVPFVPIYHVAVEMNKMETRMEDCHAVANDIVGRGPFKPKSDDLTRFGVFIAAGETPTEEELAAANAAYEKSDLELIQLADSLANEGPQGLKSITGEMRDACRRRNVVRDWAKAQKAGQQCPGCGEMVAVGIKKHVACQWRFDLGCFEGDQKGAAPVVQAQAGPKPGQPIRQG